MNPDPQSRSESPFQPDMISEKGGAVPSLQMGEVSTIDQLHSKYCFEQLGL